MVSLSLPTVNLILTPNVLHNLNFYWRTVKVKQTKRKSKNSSTNSKILNPISVKSMHFYFENNILLQGWACRHLNFCSRYKCLHVYRFTYSISHSSARRKRRLFREFSGEFSFVSKLYLMLIMRLKIIERPWKNLTFWNSKLCIK